MDIRVFSLYKSNLCYISFRTMGCGGIFKQFSLIYSSLVWTEHHQNKTRSKFQYKYHFYLVCFQCNICILLLLWKYYSSVITSSLLIDWSALEITSWFTQKKSSNFYGYFSIKVTYIYLYLNPVDSKEDF